MSVRPEVVLLWGTAGIGLLALLFPLLAGEARGDGGTGGRDGLETGRRGDGATGRDQGGASKPWNRLGIALGVIAVLFGLTRLQQYPFSPGGALGSGLVIGAVLALATVALAAFRSGTAVTAVGAGGGALLGGALVLLWHRGYPNAALAGFAAGHAIATLLATDDASEVEHPPRSKDGSCGGALLDSGESREAGGRAGLWAGPVLATVMAGAALLAISRSGEMSPAERLALDGKVYWVWPAAVMATTLAGQMVGLTLFARRAWAPLGGGLVAALLLFLLWLRFPRYAPLLAPAAAGFVTALLLLAGGRGQGAGGRENADLPVGEAADGEAGTALFALLAPALVVLLLATAYRLYSGYGIALAALGAAALLPWLAERERWGVGRALFGLLAGAILFRVYYHSYDLTNGDIPLTAHYVMVGLIAGALSPWAWASAQRATGRRGDGATGRGNDGAGPLRFALCALLFAVVLPLLLALFWGEKAGGGLLLGLVIGQGYRMMAALLEADAPGRVALAAARVTEAAPVVMGWVTVQLLDRAAAYGLQMLRVQRVGIIVALVVLCSLAVLYQAYRRQSERMAAAG